MRPKGRLPSRIYWTRRLLLAAVVLLLAGFVWWLIPGGGGSGSAAAEPGARTSTSPSTTPSTSPSTTDVKPLPHHPGATETTKSNPLPPPVPTGPCDPAKVRLAVDVHDTTVGAGNQVGLTMSTTDGSACSLGITPSMLEIRLTHEVPVTVGKQTTMEEQVVWQSTSCPDGLAAKNVVVGPVPAVVYSLRWDGNLNPDACSSTGTVGQPGTYWAEAALIGGEPSKVRFLVTTPKPAKAPASPASTTPASTPSSP